jgi:hypothetical protein
VGGNLGILGGKDMRHLAWAVTWMTVGLVTTLAVANVLTHNAQMNHPAPTPVIEPVAPTPEPVDKPMAKAKPSVDQVSRSVAAVSHRRRETTN